MNEEWANQQLLCDACGTRVDESNAAECEACGRQPLCFDCADQVEHDCAVELMDGEEQHY
ncbi:MAG: hypothetical protein AAF493_21370 [Pseudomonadota bacterium]